MGGGKVNPTSPPAKAVHQAWKDGPSKKARRDGRGTRWGSPEKLTHPACLADGGADAKGSHTARRGVGPTSRVGVAPSGETVCWWLRAPERFSQNGEEWTGQQKGCECVAVTTTISHRVSAPVIQTPRAAYARKKEYRRNQTGKPDLSDEKPVSPLLADAGKGHPHGAPCEHQWRRHFQQRRQRGTCVATWNCRRAKTTVCLPLGGWSPSTSLKPRGKPQNRLCPAAADRAETCLTRARFDGYGESVGSPNPRGMCVKLCKGRSSPGDDPSRSGSTAWPSTSTDRHELTNAEVTAARPQDTTDRRTTSPLKPRTHPRLAGAVAGTLTHGGTAPRKAPEPAAALNCGRNVRKEGAKPPSYPAKGRAPGMKRSTGPSNRHAVTPAETRWGSPEKLTHARLPG
ncbi:hypothetical protein CRENBAI_005578 [Crenichthys baileyi]|uniref:Uncharacterized protein n=1 Tax=Crenichthys baileyi TaxID=28760 RepID=A0AAV9SEX5_9TELE